MVSIEEDVRDDCWKVHAECAIRRVFGELTTDCERIIVERDEAREEAEALRDAYVPSGDLFPWENQ